MKNLKKFEKKVELLGLELTTGEVFCSDAHCYTIVLQGLMQGDKGEVFHELNNIGLR